MSLDPDHPESLVYVPQPDGSKQLVSAMYMLPDTVALADVPDIGGKLMQWHIHDNLCFTTDPVAPQVAGITSADGTCRAGLTKLPTAPMIHVWITPNKCGPFSALEGVGAGQVLPGRDDQLRPRPRLDHRPARLTSAQRRPRRRADRAAHPVRTRQVDRT